MKQFLQAIWQIILTIWQLPQIIVGDFVQAIMAGNCVCMWKNGRVYIYSQKMRGGISLGNTVILNTHYFNDGDEKTEDHEYGHARQSLYLGPLYLLIIGIPSILWAAFYNGTAYGYYTGFYTESWADKLGNVIRSNYNPWTGMVHLSKVGEVKQDNNSNS